MWQSKWALRLGLLSVLLLPFAVIGVRVGLWPFTVGFALMGSAAIIGFIAVSMVLAFVFRAALSAQRTHLTVAGLLGFSPVLLLVVLMLGAASKPRIHDISTDWVNPPQFDVLLQQRGASANTLDIKSNVIELQQLHYPQVQPIMSQLTVTDAATQAVKVGQTLGWHIVASNSEGVIEATYTSALFGFVDDISIRINTTYGGSKIDLRSVSRVGESDLGANAARIMAFSELFSSEASL